jgi:hypothetical protein
MDPKITDEGQAAKGRIATARSLINSGTPTADARAAVRTNSAPTSNIQSPVSYTPEQLAAGEPLIDIPDVPPDTTYEAAGGQLEGLTAENDAFISNLQKERDSASQSAGSSFESYLSALTEGRDVDTLTYEAEKEAGVPELEQEVNRLNAELSAEQRALKKKLDVLNANAGGGLASGVAGEIANAQRESYSKQADIAVVQMAAQGRFDTATKWAQRKAAIEFAADERVINVREKIYNANKDYFDKLDDRAFGAKTDEMKRKLDNDRKDFETLQTIKLDALKMAQLNGAPVSVLSAIQSATTPESVIQSGGQYGVTDMLQRQLITAQLNKIGFDNATAAAAARDRENGTLNEKDISNIDNSPQGKKLQTAADLKLKLSSYQQLVDKYGMELFGTNAAVLENAYKELQLSYKEAANLGVLNGPDLTIVEEAIRSATPGALGNFLNVATFGQGTRNLKANLNQAQTTLNATAQANAEQLFARDEAYRNSDYVRTILLPFGDELISSDEASRIDDLLLEISNPANQ